MPWDGAGNFTRSHDWTADDAADIDILSTRFDEEDDNFATGIGACLTKNNETKPTADFRPNATRSYDLGSTALRWRSAYLGTSLNVQSATAAAATTLAFTDATSARTFTFPDETGTIAIRGANTFTGIQTLSGAALNEAKGADIASAATTDIGAATGNLVDVTGTATITSFGTVQAGTRRFVRYTGASSITYNATSMITISRGNQTNSNGDIDEWVSLGSGNWLQVLRFPVNDGIQGLVRLNNGSVSNAATLDVVMTSYTNYRNKILLLDSFLPATDGAILWGRTSTDGGSNFGAGAADYDYAGHHVDDAGGAGVFNSGGSAQIAFTAADGTGGANIDSEATKGVSATITMYHTTSTSLHGRFEWRFTCVTTGDRLQSGWGGARRAAAEDTDAFRVLFSTGNIASGNWTLYGYN